MSKGTNEHTNEVARDYVSERSVVNDWLSYPVKFWWGLNKFETVQGVHNFLGEIADTIVTAGSFIIPSVPGRNSSSYIENSVRLTRFRNLDDKTL